MERINKAVDKYRSLILEAERYIWKHPETGYRETETSEYMADNFEKLGYEVIRADGITGFYTCIDTGREGPEVLILGELDSIICSNHPDSNPETGAVHSCGHNAQCAALSLGNNIEIVDQPGYSPFVNAPGMITLAADAAKLALPDEEFVINDRIGTGSTDMGDLSCIMSVVHPYMRGAQGTSHGSDYIIADPEAACVNSAKWQLCMLKLLLENGAHRAYEIKKGFKPIFSSKEEYLAYVDALNASGDRIVYKEDGTCEIKID